MNKSLLVVLALSAIFAGVMSQPPIPPTYDGYQQGSDSAPLFLEAYFDFQCPDSAAAWPVIKQVIQHYGSIDLKFVMHILALPYHLNSFLLQKAGAVAAQVDEDLIWKWTDLIFANQQSFFNAPTANITRVQLISKIGDLITQIGVNKDQLIRGMADSNIDSASRVSWKFATSRGMYGTPMFAVNGVTTNAASDWTFAQWTQLLDPLLKANNNKKKKPIA